MSFGNPQILQATGTDLQPTPLGPTPVQPTPGTGGGGLTIITPSPTGDDGPQINAIIASKPIIQMGVAIKAAAGNFTFVTRVSIPNNMPFDFEGSGIDQTNLYHTATAKQIFVLNRTADDQTWPSITFSRFTYDRTVNNVTGSDGALVTTLSGTRMNITDICVHDVKGNLFDTDTGGHCFLGTTHTASGQAQNNLVGLTIWNYEMNGGYKGIGWLGIGGLGTGGSNVYYNRTRIWGWSFNNNTVPVGSAISYAIQLGSTGFGGEDNWIGPGDGQNTRDVMIEVDGAQNCTIDGVTGSNCWGFMFYCTNFHQPIDVNTQKLIWRGCTAIVNNTTSDSAAKFMCQAAGLANTFAFGHIVYENCTGRFNRATIGTGFNQNGQLYGCGSNNAAATIMSLTIRGMDLTSEGWTYSGAATTWNIAMIYLNNAPTVVPIVKITDMKFITSGDNTGGTGALTYGHFRPNGAMQLEVDGMDFNSSITAHNGATGWRGLDLGNVLASTISGSIKNVTVSQMLGEGANTPFIINVSGTGTLAIPAGKEITIEDQDTTLAVAGAIPVRFNGTQNAAQVRIVRPRPIGGRPAPSAIVVTASPFTYTNLDSTGEDVFITGGTVNPVAIANDGATFVTVATATNVGVHLEPGAAVRVTYTVAPTMTKQPIP